MELYNGDNSVKSIIDVSQKTIRSISIDQAYELYQSKEFKDKKIIFMDIRNESIYKKGHIKGAIPRINTSISLDLYITKLKKDVVFVLYGADLDSGFKPSYSEPLVKIGFQHILFFTDGFKEWTFRQYPISSGDGTFAQ